MTLAKSLHGCRAIVQAGSRFLCGMSFTSSGKADRIKRKADNLVGVSKSRRLNDSNMTVESQPEEANGRVQLVYLPALDKSENDKKLYRAVQLPNGLKVLLISDPSKHGASDNDGRERSCSASSQDDEELSGDEEESDEGEEEEAEDEETEEHGEPFEDDEEPGLQKKTKSEGEKLAAAALTVRVGSFSDPADLPGLAHFLEHMVFMGSEKFPEENAFDAFIKKHGGSSNASTDCETTTFHFEIQHRYFQEASKIFAEFFISPLLRPESMQREKEAIDSEFQMAMPSDSCRKQQLFGSLANANHPMAKFMWGNSSSLKLENDPNGELLNQRVRQFWQKFYTGHRMTLAVQSKEDLDVLEQWTSEIFSKIHSGPCDEQSEDFWREYGQPFNNEKFRRIYQIVPVKDVNQLELNWSLPSQLKNYKIKPMNYLSWLIGHEGRGSLLSYLRQKVWALNLSCGNEECGFEHNSTYAKFTVSIDLTDEGWESKDRVVEAVFAYINMLKRIGPQERIYREMQNVERMSFRYVEDTNPADYVERLSENMQIYPTEHYITGDELFFEFDDKVIADCLELLQPDSMNVMLSSRKVSQLGICNQVEPHFQTQYCTQEIPQELIKCWNQADFGDVFRIPDPNPYIATNFDVLPPAADSPRYPEKLTSDTDAFTLYYKQDNVFKVPKAFVLFYLSSPRATETAKAAVLLDMMMNVLKQQLMTDTYDAYVAQLDYAVYASDRGVIIKTSGFSHKLHVLVQSIASHIGKCEENVSEEVFEAVRRETHKNYSNFALKPAKLVKDARMKLLLHKYWSVAEKLEALESISLGELVEFAKRLKEDLYIEGLVQGNLSKTEALDVGRNLLRVLRTSRDSIHHAPIRICELPRGEVFCRLASFNKDDANSVVVNYYQWGPTNIRYFAIMEVVVMLMEEPVFDVLRTREQLGYDVSVMLRNTFGVLGFSITVNFQADKFSASHVDERIEAFLANFKSHLAEMSQSDLDTTLNALIRLKQRPDVALDEEVNRNWGEVTTEELLFDRIEREIECLHHVTIDQVRDVFQSLVATGDQLRFRKASVQVVGQQKKSESQTNDTLTRFEYLGGEAGKVFLDDIDDYRRTLHVFEPLKTFSGLPDDSLSE